jgi:hypothetical protein
MTLCAQVDGVPVYSSATPTVDGAKAILAHLNAEPSASNDPFHVVISDLREEVVVYIHGNPFVLRELDQPVNTLKHVGISGPAVRRFSCTSKSIWNSFIATCKLKDIFLPCPF